VRLLVEPERAGLTAGAHDAPGGAREADEVVVLAAVRACGQLGGEAGGQQELQAEGERVAAGGKRRLGVQQREVVGEQVVDAAVRLAVVEQARDRLAGARGAVQRPGVLAQARMARQRFGARDRQQVRAALVEHQVEPEIRLQAPAEARAGTADAFGDRR
jgi:hypothetical protein